MQHNSGDNLISVGSGAVLSIIGNVAGWIGDTSFLFEAFGTVAMGLLGGVAGFVGKKGIEWIYSRSKRRNKGCGKC